MNNWKEELELIENLGLLYPIINGWYEYDKNWDNFNKTFWACCLCIRNLNQRIPQLEEFIIYHLDGYWVWGDYKEHFNIK